MIWLENIDVIGTTAYVQKEKEKVTDIYISIFILGNETTQ